MTERRQLIEHIHMALEHQTVPVFRIGRVGEKATPAEALDSVDRLKWFREYWDYERMREQRP